MIRCYITDRRLRGLAAAVREQVEWIQIRDKQLAARDLLEVTCHVIGSAPAAKVIVNTRMDVALAGGAAGLHLPGNSIAANRWRVLAPPGFLIGASCHTLEEVVAAEREGANYVLFGPVFKPLSKESDLMARGVGLLEQAVRSVKIPVLALGGITRDNQKDCLAAGAAGIAAISLFETC
jgi:thiamine-phosphate diphosphorylase